jgi:basic membrane protein A
MMAVMLTLVGSAAGQDAPAVKPVQPKVALVFDLGGRGDNGFNDAAYSGMEKAVTDLGVQAVYIERKRNLDLDHALKQAATSDAGMIIGVGFAFSDKLQDLARTYPGKKFVSIDYSTRPDASGRPAALPPNLAGVQFREEEGSFLVGALAALKSKSGSIGFIGGMDSPLIRKFEAGYRAGAFMVRPDIRVTTKFAGITSKAFNDPQAGYRFAREMYGNGADIIYHAAGATGAGLFRAAEELNRLAIGVDRDQYDMAPGHVLTSMTKHSDVAVYDSVAAFVGGRFAGGVTSLGLKENGVGFVLDRQNSRLIPAEIRDRVLALQTKIIAGDLLIPVTSSQRTILSRQELQDLLTRLQGEVATVLQSLDSDLQLNAEELSGRDLKGDYARDLLQQLYRAHPYIIDCETVSSKGVMVAVEPPGHRKSEGADISRQTHMVKLFKTKKPVLSGSFRSVEGPEAVVIHQPIFSANRRFTGSIAALFAPEYLLASIIGPVASNLPVDIFLMQTDGLTIYDVDAQQIGRNVFRDRQYKRYPGLVALARKVAATPEGTGSYRFPLPGAAKAVEKVAYWRTVTLHGRAWRLVISCARENLEP